MYLCPDKYVTLWIGAVWHSLKGSISQQYLHLPQPEKEQHSCTVTSYAIAIRYVLPHITDRPPAYCGDILQQTINVVAQVSHLQS